MVDATFGFAGFDLPFVLLGGGFVCRLFWVYVSVALIVLLIVLLGSFVLKLVELRCGVVFIMFILCVS